jgi:hypothetical protein
LNEKHGNEVYINPVLRKPKALRSMLPVLLNQAACDKAASGNIYPFYQEREDKKEL